MSYRAVVLTISDGCFRGERQDKSGPALVSAVQQTGIDVPFTEVVPDDYSTIVSVLQKYLADSSLHLILTTGGTGFGPRDVTPEATQKVLERNAPGLAEILRQEGATQTKLSWLSRGVAGTASGKLIINLPGSTRAMAHSIEVLKPLLFHALDLLNGGHPH